MNTAERHLSDSIDFYKFPMGQEILEQHPDATVTFTMKNRADAFPLSEYVSEDELEARLKAIQHTGFTAEEIAYLGGLEAQLGGARFDEPYLTFLENLALPDVRVTTDPHTGELAVDAMGQWAAVSIWETVVMSEVNELYYKNLMKANGLNLADVWAEGDKRLSDKINRIQNTNIRFADFGTRRRFSADWQAHAIERLAAELPNNFVGTSNPWFAYKYNLAPIGTYAHEMPMGYAALADQRGDNPLTGHKNMMEHWYERYGKDLSIGLTDTFTSDFFFSDFTKEQAKQWRGLRHDSGDPVAFGERAIQFYTERGINPLDKALIFSDGLDIDTIFALQEVFEGRINVLFGWGTTLMNDLGLRPNNFVMKATQVNGISTVKLSDVAGKHTGPAAQVERYEALVNARLAAEQVYKPIEQYA